MSGYKAHFRFTWKMLVYLAFGLALSLAVLYFYTARPLTGSYAHALLTLKLAREGYALYAARICFYLYTMLVLLIFIASLLASHRIAGPVFRMTRSAELAAKGNFSCSVRVRKRDHLKETVNDMDETLALLREKLSQTKSAAERMRVISGGLEAADEAVQAELLQRLETEHAELKKQLSFFKT